MRDAESRVTLAHGNGGRKMRELLERHLRAQLGDPGLDLSADAVPVDVPSAQIGVSTDGFTVQPIEFPGGTIGSLAVHGTVNDLAVSGHEPLVLTLGMVIEEGLDFDVLDRILADLGKAAPAAGVRVVAGDTKVVPRGEGGGLYLTTTGIGRREHPSPLGFGEIRAGDRLIVSGPVGDHAVAVLLAREEFGLRSDLESDSASVLPLTRALRNLPGLRFMRDPTRGGLATVAHDIAEETGLSVELVEADIPVRPSVRSVCDMLGYDPLYLACEGRVIAVVAPDEAERLVDLWRATPEGTSARIIGTVRERGTAPVCLRTPIGGTRILEPLEDDPLPRIC